MPWRFTRVDDFSLSFDLGHPGRVWKMLLCLDSLEFFEHYLLKNQVLLADVRHDALTYALTWRLAWRRPLCVDTVAATAFARCPGLWRDLDDRAQVFVLMQHVGQSLRLLMAALVFVWVAWGRYAEGVWRDVDFFASNVGNWKFLLAFRVFLDFALFKARDGIKDGSFVRNLLFFCFGRRRAAKVAELGRRRGE